MRAPTYIAELNEADYPQFRAKDPTLPATYKGWLELTADRIRLLRQRGENPVRYPIRFDAFAERNEMLAIPDFDEATRDDYADEMAAANAVSFRL